MGKKFPPFRISNKFDDTTYTIQEKSVRGLFYSGCIENVDVFTTENIADAYKFEVVSEGDRKIEVYNKNGVIINRFEVMSGPEVDNEAQLNDQAEINQKLWQNEARTPNWVHSWSL